VMKSAAENSRWQVVWAAVIWSVWYSRNQCKFQNIKVDIQRILFLSRKDLGILLPNGIFVLVPACALSLVKAMHKCRIMYCFAGSAVLPGALIEISCAIL